MAKPKLSSVSLLQKDSFKQVATERYRLFNQCALRTNINFLLVHASLELGLLAFMVSPEKSKNMGFCSTQVRD